MKRTLWFKKVFPKANFFLQRCTPIRCIFLMLCLISFGVLKLVDKGIHYMTTDHIAPQAVLEDSIFLAGGLRWFDKHLAQTLFSATRLGNAVLHKHELLPAYEQELQNISTYIASGGSVLTKSLFQKIPFFPLLQEVASFQEDIVSLLGKEQEQTYLLILQNSSEKRPNGGFFWSFAILKIRKGRITHLEITDSYLPDFDRPNTFITGPERLRNFLPEREIYFVWANKVGFTYHDGANIKTLYEKSYPWQKVRGVIFLRTDMFEYLMPGFTKQLRERQFVNAASDLIRGAGRRGKKELYLASSQAYFMNHKTELIRSLLLNLHDLIQQRYINIYLTDISWWFHGFLRRHHLTTRFENDEGYFRDSNISFNKSDRFVKKRVVCTGDTMTNSLDTTVEIVPLSTLGTGNHQCTITYNLHIPDDYRTFIADLERKYNITLWSREHHILSLTDQRASRGIIYLPPHMTITTLTGAVVEPSIFATPFANAASYKTSITQQDGTATVYFSINVSPTDSGSQ